MGKIYSESWAGQYLGEVRADGRVYDRHLHCVGKIEPDGKLYDSDWIGRCVGKIESDGKIYDSSWGGHCFARVESNGKVYDSKWAGNCMGRVEGFASIQEGAGLILLQQAAAAKEMAEADGSGEGGCSSPPYHSGYYSGGSGGGSPGSGQPVSTAATIGCFAFAAVPVVLYFFIGTAVLSLLGVAVAVLGIGFFVSRRNEVSVSGGKVLAGLLMGFGAFWVSAFVVGLLMAVFSVFGGGSPALNAMMDATGWNLDIFALGCGIGALFAFLAR